MDEQSAYHTTIDGAPPDFGAPLPASELNIETKLRSNLFPWRGQFSPQLVESLLRAYAPAGATVLDPFMGSGTVLVEAARLGLAAYGFEINPAAYSLARVYEFCALPATERHSFLQAAEAELCQMYPSAFELPLFRSQPSERLVPGIRAVRIPESVDPHVRTLLEAFVVLLDRSDACDHTCSRVWDTIRSVVVELPYSQREIRACFGDARALTLPDNSIDFVLTSPPYINVFNYHQNFRTGVELLGWNPLIVARSEIGSNRKFRQNRFLTVIQYSIDMTLALAQICRVCRPNARMILILGRESNVHRTAFFNGHMLRQLATDVLGMRLHREQQRIFTNRFGQHIYEDILYLTPPANPKHIAADLIERARVVGTGVLIEALNRTPPDRLPYLRAAIAEAHTVAASPILKLEDAREEPL